MNDRGGVESADCAAALVRARRRLERERRARHEAETIAEHSTRELYDRQQELALLEAVATKANEARTIEHALQAALDLLCTHLDWPVGQAWVVTAADGVAEPARAAFCPNHARHETFVSASTQLQFGPGAGLIGSVLEHARPAWIRDVEEDPAYLRISAARTAGLHGTVAFPVLVDGHVAAILECLSEAPVEPDKQLLRILGQIGEHLARVVERVTAEQTLRFDASHDALTGLPNRHRFIETIHHSIAHPRADRPCTAVAVLDIDRFKEVNDTLGHLPGDQLLHAIAQRLKAATSTDDTVARLGADVFGILLYATDQAQAEKTAQWLRSALDLPFSTSGVHIHIDCSVGIALSPTHGNDANTLLRRADIALNGAKSSRRGVFVYQPERDEHTSDRLGLAAALRCALDSEQLAVFYQPKVAVADPSTVVGAEALIRWTHPERGMVSPAEFIPLAESTGLIRPLTTLVLRTVLNQVKAWASAGLELPVAVNISANSLRDPKFPAEVTALLDEAGISPHLLELEVTETSMLQDPVIAEQSLQTLSEAGITLSIDDFGTGYSSMAQLKQLPVDKLKVDRGFVGTMTVDSRDGVLVRSTIQLAHNLGLRVVAEGVEDLETLYMLNSMGCDEAQGYLFLPAVPATELPGWIAQHGAAHTPANGHADPTTTSRESLTPESLRGPVVTAEPDVLSLPIAPAPLGPVTDATSPS